jgi:hypothetical protein
MSNVWYPANAITGGSDGALDALDGAALNDGDIALVAVTGDKLYCYYLDEDSGEAESSPDIISPDSNAGDKRWILLFQGSASASLSYLIVSDDVADDTLPTLIGTSLCKCLGSYKSMISNSYGSEVLGGENNQINADENDSAYDCTIVGGYANRLISGDGSAILGGTGNLIFFGYYGQVLGGYDNVSSNDYAAVVGGDNNKAVGYYSTITGGLDTLTNIDGQCAHGGRGQFSVVGDNQRSFFVADGVTGVSAILEPSYAPLGNKTARIHASVVARDIDGTYSNIGDAATWEIVCLVTATGGTQAQGTLEVNDLPSNGDTLNIDQFEFRFVPSETNKYETDIVIGLTAAETAENIYDTLSKFLVLYELSYDAYVTITITSIDRNDSYNNVDFYTDSTALTLDGSDYLGGTVAGVDKTVSVVGTTAGVGSPAIFTPAIAAQGTIALTGLPSTDETFVVDTQTFTWKTSRGGTGEVTIGGDIDATLSNIVTAITTDLTTVDAVADTDTDTVVVTANDAGYDGNEIVFTESTSNMTMDATTLGSTTAGSDGAEFWTATVAVNSGDMSLEITVNTYSDVCNVNADVKVVELG